MPVVGACRRLSRCNARMIHFGRLFQCAAPSAILIAFDIKKRC